MPTVEDHQLAVAALLAPLAARPHERWKVATPPRGETPRVLAEDVVAPIDLPPFDNSQMDGYAVRSAEIADAVEQGTALRVGERIAAGHTPAELPEGTAAPIMTGAPIPPGADAVIPIEAALPNHFLIAADLAAEDPDAGLVCFTEPVAHGTFVRWRGSDLAAGELLLEEGMRLGAAQWGVLAASGVPQVLLLSRVRVLLISTGDELAAVGEALAPGKIYDANGTSLAIALRDAGAEVVDTLLVTDDASALRAVIHDYAGRVDLVLTTGGVSAGAYEVVRGVVEPAGVVFESVAMQPGGPQGLGLATLDGAEVPVVAFPGNPVSALVSFEMFLRPVLRRLHGLPADRPRALLSLAHAVDSPERKHQVRRATVDVAGLVHLVGGSSSHLLHSYALSTHLVHLPVGVGGLDAGSLVETWSIHD